MDMVKLSGTRAISSGARDHFDPPRDPRILPRPTRELCHLYVWHAGRWVELRTDAE